MRDLYAKLGIPPDAGETRIRAELSRCADAALESDAAAVLTVPSRRRQFDRLNGLLHDIADLRRRLGLNECDNWRGAAAFEYTRRGAREESARGRYRDKAGQRTATAADVSGTTHYSIHWLIIAIIVAAAGAAVWHWLA
jgi:hypothetical protein